MPRQRKPKKFTSETIDLSEVKLAEPEDGIVSAYANVVNLNWTVQDVRLRFAELVQVPSEDSPTWEDQAGVLLEKVAVTIPWHQAKTLRDMLTELIQNYEKLNGELRPINLPQAL